VEVAHHQDGCAAPLLGLELLEDAAVEGELERDAAVVALLAVAVREVRVDHDEPTEARELEAPLGVERRIAERVGDLFGRARRAAVAGPLRRGEVPVPALERARVLLELVLPRADLLQADDGGARA